MNGCGNLRETAQRRVNLRESRLDSAAGSWLIPSAQLGGWFGSNNPNHRPPARLRSQNEREAQASPGRHRPPVGGRRVLRLAVRLPGVCIQGRHESRFLRRMGGFRAARRAED